MYHAKDTLNTYPYNLKEITREFVEYSLFDEFLNAPNHCVEFLYETIMYVYNGRYYSDLMWLSEDFVNCGFGLFSTAIPYVNYSLWFLQITMIFLSEVYSIVTPIDYVISDTYFESSVIANCPSYLLRYHPEILDYYNADCYKPYIDMSPLEKELMTVSNVMCLDNFISGYITNVTILVVAYITVSFYFNVGQVKSDNESTTDAEYLTICSLVEGEKEIGSVDDLLFVAIHLIYMFGWFFGAYFYLIVSRLPELVILMYSLPGIFYIVFSIPTYLAYDYGILYGTYLRGSGGTSFLMFELGYDYIAIAIFYIRLALQSIRLVIMVITYASFHDYMLFYNIRPSAYTNPSKIFSCNFNYGFTQLLIYYAVVSVPCMMIYLAYELLHLFFVLVSQTVAFFAMIF